MRPYIAVAVVFASVLLLSACGQTPTDRALSGAGIGAAGGALLGSVVGAPGIGAMAGTAVGATAGAATDQSQIYLGKPIWK